MVDIAVGGGTITLNHEWPLGQRVDKYREGEPVVSLEVDTDLGTAVVALDLVELIALADRLDGFVGYYDSVEEVEWSSR